VCKVIENFFPYAFSLAEDDSIGMFQSFLRQSSHMESAQYYLCPFRAQTIGDPINIRHVVGQPDDQGQLAVLPVGTGSFASSTRRISNRSGVREAIAARLIAG